ncbi:hypothetical protein RCH09_002048 [Actimicrobium sp. GrIS 1.19]|uniref:DUF4936 family protein n=1 Tax=Actimicrobium sp. GrIS 1.19 TaxID=3071708 RepID=UPI002E0311C4|nr:hypothetical protein [Actimicrobium sp. GrIS 1.19]
MDLYIYYTIQAGDAALALQRVTQLQQQLAAAYDIVPQRKRRVDQSDGVQTWMEIYPAVPPGFDRVIAQAAAEHGLTALAQGERHVEYFSELTPCA